MKDLYSKTLETNENIINSGYKLKQIWECDWDTMIKLACKGDNIDQLPEKIQKNYTLLKKYNDLCNIKKM